MPNDTTEQNSRVEPVVKKLPLGQTRFLIPIGLLVILVVVLGVGPVDDTYIFLRYARNIATGVGPVFNVGERVEGFSSPLWTFLLGGLGTWVDLEWLAYLFGIFFAGLCLAAATAWCHDRAESGIEARILMLGLASCPVLVFAAGSGMDTALFAALTTLSIASALADLRRGTLSTRTVILLLLATLTRSEGLLLAAFTTLFLLAHRRNVRRITLFFICVAALHLVRYAYYGSWVPNTAYAKIAFALPERLDRGFRYLGSALVCAVPLLPLGWMIAVAGIRAAPAARQRWAFLTLWVLLYTAYVAYVGGDNIPAFRIFLPVLPAMCLLVAESWTPALQGWTAGRRRAALALLVMAVASANVFTYRRVSKAYFADMRLATAWTRVGKWVDEHTPPDTILATPVVGAIGYFGQRTTIDMLGLTDKTVARDGRVYPKAAHGHARYHTDHILACNPDLILYMSSGRFTEPVYSSPDRIHKPTGYALYDLVTDPRTKRRYAYETAQLSDGTLVEMLTRKDTARSAMTWDK